MVNGGLILVFVWELYRAMIYTTTTTTSVRNLFAKHMDLNYLPYEVIAIYHFAPNLLAILLNYLYVLNILLR